MYIFTKTKISFRKQYNDYICDGYFVFSFQKEKWGGNCVVSHFQKKKMTQLKSNRISFVTQHRNRNEIKTNIYKNEKKNRIRFKKKNKRREKNITHFSK